VRRLVRDRVFRVLYVSGFLQGLALFVPIVFLAPMAQHYGMSAARAAALVGAIGDRQHRRAGRVRTDRRRIGVLFDLQGGDGRRCGWASSSGCRRGPSAACSPWPWSSAPGTAASSR
jgi:hypothetical protein